MVIFHSYVSLPEGKSSIYYRICHEINHPAIPWGSLEDPGLVGRNLHHQIGPQLGQVRPFVLDHVRNQLVLQQCRWKAILMG